MHIDDDGNMVFTYDMRKYYKTVKTAFTAVCIICLCLGLLGLVIDNIYLMICFFIAPEIVVIYAVFTRLIKSPKIEFVFETKGIWLDYGLLGRVRLFVPYAKITKFYEGRSALFLQPFTIYFKKENGKKGRVYRSLHIRESDMFRQELVRRADLHYSLIRNSYIKKT